MEKAFAKTALPLWSLLLYSDDKEVLIGSREKTVSCSWLSIFLQKITTLFPGDFSSKITDSSKGAMIPIFKSPKLQGFPKMPVLYHPWHRLWRGVMGTKSPFSTTLIGTGWQTGEMKDLLHFIFQYLRANSQCLWNQEYGKGSRDYIYLSVFLIKFTNCGRCLGILV